MNCLPVYEQSLGDDDEHDIPLLWKGAAFDPTGYDLIFTAKFSEDDLDGDSAFQKDSGRGISVAGTTAKVEILRADTLDLGRGTLICDIQAKNQLTRKFRTVAEFKIKLKRDITRLGEVSLNINLPPIPAYLTLARNRRTGNWTSIYLDQIDGDLVLQSEVVFPTSVPDPAIIYNRRMNRYETLYVDEVDGDGTDTVQTEIFGATLPEYPTASLVINRVTGQAARLFIDEVEGDGTDTLQTEILIP